MTTRHGDGESLRYASGFHAPVLYEAVVHGIVTDSGGVYVDATLGGGGHTAALLDALSSRGRVIGIDQDVEAIEAASSRLAADIERGRFIAVHGNFEDLERLLAELGETPVDGLVLDLGVSSHQLGTASRGFSYLAAGELDMRMDTREGARAHDVVNEWDRRELRRVLSTYGEEPRSARLARAIVEARPLGSTLELADVVRRHVPPREEVKTLSRVFQAIRIAVNREIEVLEAVLESSVRILRPGGRIAVICYHSLEDRRAKRFLRYGNFEGEPSRDLYGKLLTPWREVTRKPVRPNPSEIEANPRARSARLRIAERSAASWPPSGGTVEEK
jgi:16S rRNA (cytosine1402-N4)-methyltransferase